MNYLRNNKLANALQSASLAIVGLVPAYPVSAAVITKVEVLGTERTGEEAVRSNLTISPTTPFTAADVDSSIKKLYDTGYYDDVQITVEKDVLRVSVVENELINQIVFNGNRKIKDEKLQGIVQSQTMGPYRKALIESDVERIKEAYRQIGRSDVAVSYQTVPVGKGRVNVAFSIEEGEKTKITDILFVGNKGFSSQRLKSIIQTKETGPLSFLTRKDVYSEDKKRADEESLRKFYYNHGYPDFRILSSQATLNSADNSYSIAFTVDEGERYSYGSVQIESSIQGVGTEELIDSLETRAGAPYDARQIQTTVDAITKQAASRGYPFARVTPRGNRDVRSHTIGITYAVDEGERAYVERIEIRGNTRTRDYIIRREFDFSEGDAFNQSMVARAKRRLEALGYFSSVNISTAHGSAADRVVVIVDVEDQSTGSFGIGAGYSADDGVLLEASVEEKNFLGRGQYIRIAAGVGDDDSQTYNLSFTEPYFLGYRLAAGFDVFRSQSSSNDYYTYSEQGVTLRLTAPITEGLASTFRYTYKQIGYEEDGAYGDDGIAYTSDDEMSAPYIALIEHGTYIQSSIAQTLTYNTLDSQTSPHEGWYATATQEFAGLGGDSNFYKLSARARYYQTLSTERDLIGSISFDAGHVFSTSGDNLYVFDQFKIGGKQIRGFKTNGIGPRTVDDGDALGGTTYFTTSAELTMPVPGLSQDAGFRLAVFSDAGTLYGNLVDGAGDDVEGENMSIRASVGAGIIWDSPFGSIRLDYAEPVLKEDFDKVQQFKFSMTNAF